MSSASSKGCSLWLSSLLVSMVSLWGSAARADDAGPPCRIVSSQQVSAIMGSPMEMESAVVSRENNTATCRFKSERNFAAIRTSRLASDAAAMSAYRETLEVLSRGASRTEPLHGVGTESRLVLKLSTTIVARFGVHIVVVSTEGDRSAVVGLARAVGAKVIAQ